MKLQYVTTDEWIFDVLKNPLARMKFLGRSLVFSRSRFAPRGNDETESHSDMVRGLGSLHGQM